MSCVPEVLDRPAFGSGDPDKSDMVDDRQLQRIRARTANDWVGSTFRWCGWRLTACECPIETTVYDLQQPLLELVKRTDEPDYDEAEAALILKKELGVEFSREEVRILVRNGTLAGSTNERGFEFTWADLARFITRTRLERFHVTSLSETVRQDFFSRSHWSCWTALFVVHGVEPTDDAAQIAAFVFPSVYWKLSRAIQQRDIGAERDGADTPTDTIDNWQRWFSKPDYRQEWWLDPQITGAMTAPLMKAVDVSAKTPAVRGRPATRPRIEVEALKRLSDADFRSKHRTQQCEDIRAAILGESRRKSHSERGFSDRHIARILGELNPRGEESA